MVRRRPAAPDPLLVSKSLLQVVSFALGSTFANLAGTHLMSRNDAADRLHLLAQAVSIMEIDVPQVAELMAERLEAMAAAIADGTFAPE